MDSPVVLGKDSQFPSLEPDDPVPVKKFYQGEPVALGITQILIGIIGIVFGILLNFIDDDDSTYFLLIKIPYWGGILAAGAIKLFQERRGQAMIFWAMMLILWSIVLPATVQLANQTQHIISGSLTVAAARNPKIPLVKGMLAMNVISVITAGLGIVFLSFSVSPFLPFDFGNNCNYRRYYTKEKCDEIQNIGKGILIFLTVLAILEFCISISLAFFGCKIFCRDPFTETVVVVYQNVTPSSTEQQPPFNCKQPAIHP